MHPELENTGPAEFDITKTEQWLHDKQKQDKRIGGNQLYVYLKKNGILKTCLGLRDLEEIQKKGIVFFRKYFKSKYVCGWKGVVMSRHDDDLKVPYLCELDDKVVQGWHDLISRWPDASPALRFAS
jgi:hypothetical protein